MARTSSKAKKTKQEVMKSKTENIKKDAEPESEHGTDNEKNDDNYEVEKIIHSRIYRGKRQYLIRWKGYDEGGDTWEDESAADSCPEALEEFKKKGSTIDDTEFENEQCMKENKPDKNKSKSSLDEKINIKGKKPNSKESKKTSTSESDNEPTVNESDPENDKGEQSKKKGLKRKANNQRGKNKQKMKVSKEGSEDEPLTDGNDYEVEKIIEVHSKRDGTKEFLIRWKGYSSKDDTWEPEAHLDCKELIAAFMEKVAKAKNTPAKELRESRTDNKKFITTVRAARKHNLRTMNLRPFYQE